MQSSRRLHLAIGFRFLSFLLLFSVSFVVPAQEVTTADRQGGSGAETGAIQGTVVDEGGAIVARAAVTLTNVETHEVQSTESDSAGSYSFASLPAGEFSLTVSVHGFLSFTDPQVRLASSQLLQLPEIVLRLATVSSNVEVTASKQEVAEAQMKSELKQRLVGILPNYYVVYFKNPAPLNARQKMRLAFRQAIDPVNFGLAAAEAGAQTNNKNYKEYGAGAEGFAKRYGAAYADDFIGTIIGSGVMHTVFRQDPRYYYKGTGSIASRTLYALSWSVRCKGDNGKWQFNYSSMLGDVASAGISNLYYPRAIHNNAGQIAQYSLLNVASRSVNALLQEFLFKCVTTHSNEPGKVRD